MGDYILLNYDPMDLAPYGASLRVYSLEKGRPMSMTTIIFFVLILASFSGFAWTVQRMIRKMMRGRPADRIWDQWGARIVDVVNYFFLQRSVAREATSWHHLLIFWGFWVIVAGTVEILINGLIPTLSFELFGSTFNAVFKATLDVVNLVVLVMILYALFRRIVLRPNLIPMSADAGLILGMIGMLCLSHFVSHGFHFPVKSGGDPALVAAIMGPPGSPEYMPVSAQFGRIAETFSHGSAHTVASAAYWVHVIIILFFLNYIPYSKHLHLLGSLPNILLRRKAQKGILPKVDLEDMDQWGAGRYEQFDWKALLDSYACTECARCTNNCPAYVTGKPLSPMKIIHDMRDEMKARGEGLIQIRSGVNTSGDDEIEGLSPNEQEQTILDKLAEQPPMVGGRVSEEALWACTTCGACEESCPVFIEQPLAIVQMRTHLTLTEGRIPNELGRMFRGMETNSNPWGMGAESRMDWAKDLDVPIMAEKGTAEYLVWVGCAGSFDPEGQKTTRALISLLNQAGVDYAVLGNEEGCTGDAARRAGNEYLFQTMAEQNIEAFKQYDVKKILTSCPHCLHSFKNEYPQFEGSYEVVHHSQFIQELIRDGKLKGDGKIEGGVTYHDPCYLGRWNDEYEAPRDVVRQAAGEEISEMPRTREKSFCCGAGGAQMWMEESGDRVNVNRTSEAVETGAGTIATACPFCRIMVNDGLKALDKDEEIQVMDIAQLVARNNLPAE